MALLPCFTMITYNQNIIKNALHLLASYACTPDESKNYYLCDLFLMLVKHPDAKNVLVTQFGEEYNKKFSSIMQYAQQLSVVKFYLDLHNDGKINTTSPEMRTKLFQRCIFAQMQLPLIKSEIWDLLYPIIANSNLNGYTIKPEHMRPILLKYNRLMKVRLAPGGDKRESFNKRSDGTKSF